MIHFDDWLLTKDEGPVIARQYDNLTRRLEILGDIPEGWSWTLLVQADKHLDLIALTPMEGGLGVDLTAEMLAVSGYYTVQLKGVRGELVRHTNQVRIFIPDSLSGDANWPEVPSEFSQMEANIRALGAHPPVPGDEGFWLVWDLERGEYVTSGLPLPDVSVGPAGKAATIKVGETVTGDPGTQAAVENTGTENAAVLRFTIPRGAVGPTGATPAISVEVTGLPAGAEPTAEVSGTPEAPVIALGIPAGRQGDPGTPGTNGTDGRTPNITIGQVETLPAGSDVTATITGETPNLVLNLGIPRGLDGDGVPPTDTAKKGDVPTFDGQSVVWAAAAGGNAAPKLIIEDTADEDVAYLYYNQASDGSPIDIRRIIAIMECPAESVVSSKTSMWLRMGDGTVGDADQAQYGAGVNGVEATWALRYCIEAELLEGYVRNRSMTNGGFGGITSDNTYLSSVTNEVPYSKIGEIKILLRGASALENIPAGTVVKIWSY